MKHILRFLILIFLFTFIIGCTSTIENDEKDDDETNIEDHNTDPNPVTPIPVDPNPADPEPVVPEPVVPEPFVPEPVDPNPADPEPVDPEPVDPNPADPEPVDPNPVDPNPVDPNPVDPDPVDPEPVTNDIEQYLKLLNDYKFQVENVKNYTVITDQIINIIIETQKISTRTIQTSKIDLESSILFLDILSDGVSEKSIIRKINNNYIMESISDKYINASIHGTDDEIDFTSILLAMGIQTIDEILLDEGTNDGNFKKLTDNKFEIYFDLSKGSYIEFEELFYELGLDSSLIKQMKFKITIELNPFTKEINYKLVLNRIKIDPQFSIYMDMSIENKIKNVDATTITLFQDQGYLEHGVFTSIEDINKEYIVNKDFQMSESNLEKGVTYYAKIKINEDGTYAFKYDNRGMMANLLDENLNKVSQIDQNDQMMVISYFELTSGYYYIELGKIDTYKDSFDVNINKVDIINITKENALPLDGYFTIRTTEDRIFVKKEGFPTGGLLKITAQFENTFDGVNLTVYPNNKGVSDYVTNDYPTKYIYMKANEELIMYISTYNSSAYLAPVNFSLKTEFLPDSTDEVNYIEDEFSSKWYYTGVGTSDYTFKMTITKEGIYEIKKKTLVFYFNEPKLNVYDSNGVLIGRLGLNEYLWSLFLTPGEYTVIAKQSLIHGGYQLKKVLIAETSHTTSNISVSTTLTTTTVRLNTPNSTARYNFSLTESSTLNLSTSPSYVNLIFVYDEFNNLITGDLNSSTNTTTYNLNNGNYYILATLEPKLGSLYQFTLQLIK